MNENSMIDKEAVFSSLFSHSVCNLENIFTNSQISPPNPFVNFISKELNHNANSFIQSYEFWGVDVWYKKLGSSDGIIREEGMNTPECLNRQCSKASSLQILNSTYGTQPWHCFCVTYTFAGPMVGWRESIALPISRLTAFFGHSCQLFLKRVSQYYRIFWWPCCLCHEYSDLLL